MPQGAPPSSGGVGAGAVSSAAAAAAAAAGPAAVQETTRMMKVPWDEVEQRLKRILEKETFSSLTLKEVSARLQANYRKEGKFVNMKEHERRIEKIIEDHLIETFSLLPRVLEVLNEIVKMLPDVHSRRRNEEGDDENEIDDEEEGKQEGGQRRSLDELITKLATCRKMVKVLRGIDVSREEQLKLRRSLRETLVKKRKLVQKFISVVGQQKKSGK
eukprot:jgi/Bigna1/143485/aug1.79_g18193